MGQHQYTRGRSGSAAGGGTCAALRRALRGSSARPAKRTHPQGTQAGKHTLHVSLGHRQFLRRRLLYQPLSAGGLSAQYHTALKRHGEHTDDGGGGRGHFHRAGILPFLGYRHGERRVRSPFRQGRDGGNPHRLARGQRKSRPAATSCRSSRTHEAVCGFCAGKPARTAKMLSAPFVCCGPAAPLDEARDRRASLFARRARGLIPRRGQG